MTVTQGEMEEKNKWKDRMKDVAKTTFMRSCDVIEGGALRSIAISRKKRVNIVEQSRVLCEDYIYCRLQVYCPKDGIAALNSFNFFH